MTGDVTLGDLLRFKKAIAPGYQFNTDTSAVSHTLLPYQIVGANALQPVLPSSLLGPDEVVIDLTGALTGAANITLPTASQIISSMPNTYIGEMWKVRFKNDSSGAFAWTLVANTGITLNGTSTIAQATARDFYFTVTGVGANAAITVQNVGSVNA